MKKCIMILICSFLCTMFNLQAAVTSPAMQTVVIPIGYEFSIINLSTTPATFNGMTIQYSRSDQPNQKPLPTLTTTANIPVPAQTAGAAATAQKGIAFTPKIMLQTNNASITTQFEGVTQLMINNQPVTFVEPSLGTAPFYINNVQGRWQIVPAPKAVAKKAPTKKTPSMQTVNAATKVYNDNVTPQPKQTQSIPKAPAQPKLSKSSNTATNAIAKTTTA